MDPDDYKSVDEYVNIALAEFDRKYEDMPEIIEDSVLREFYKQSCIEFYEEVKSGRLNRIDIIPEDIS